MQRLSPLQQQSLALLALSTQALEQRVHDMLESNPLLEEKLDSDQEEYDQTEKEEVRIDSWEEGRLTNGDNDNYSRLSNGDDWEESSVRDRGQQAGDERTISLSRDTSLDESRGSVDYLPGKDVSFYEYLEQEIASLQLNTEDQRIATAIAGSINSDGRLEDSIEEIRQNLAPEMIVHDEKIETILHLLQNLDPPGIFARDLQECLLLQLERRDDESATIAAAITIVRDHWGPFSKWKDDQISRNLDITKEQTADARKVIKELDPRPGRQLDTTTADYIKPDIIVRRVDDHWDVKLNPETEHRLQISQHYKQYMEGSKDKTAKDWVKDHLKMADWFIDSLNQRSATMLRVARVITARQKKFMAHGHKALQPLMMTEIADELEIHESTVSRAVSGKYMDTPHGAIEMRRFFPSQIATTSGEGMASDAVQAIIKKIIDNEPFEKPLSDEKISRKLKDKDINAARRTVTKYREKMNIPPSSERRQMRNI